ncbi:response regulator [Flavobacterium celericrescens]|uniref:Response regulator n=1 Tax=Flavobacterium celericrescens TaxID=2709780 RepID=A0ABX0IEX3_9FLAO|nr:response regulator [Flavobacterium celericrescens]NHM05066.1 response regulator [Flavobacterium celericrescens]
MKQLLIIDDDAVSVLILKKMLINAGFLDNPMIFKNGNEAINFLNSNYKSIEKYFIFLDINMPIMNGWEFLEEIEPKINTENFSVYLLTSSTSEQDIIKSKNYKSIKKFISKPVAKEILSEIKEEFY